MESTNPRQAEEQRDSARRSLHQNGRACAPPPPPPSLFSFIIFVSFLPPPPGARGFADFAEALLKLTPESLRRGGGASLWGGGCRGGGVQRGWAALMGFEGEGGGGHGARGPHLRAFTVIIVIIIISLSCPRPPPLPSPFSLQHDAQAPFCTGCPSWVPSHLPQAPCPLSYGGLCSVLGGGDGIENMVGGRQGKFGCPLLTQGRRILWHCAAFLVSRMTPSFCLIPPCW